MAKLHILESNSGYPDTFRIVVHVAVPTGNNQAGVPWVTALKNSGAARSRMLEGNGPGQITHQELTKIEDGELLEIETTLTIDPTWTPQVRLAELDGLALRTATEMIEQFRNRFRWFGSIRA